MNAPDDSPQSQEADSGQIYISVLTTDSVVSYRLATPNEKCLLMTSTPHEYSTVLQRHEFES